MFYTLNINECIWMNQIYELNTAIGVLLLKFFFYLSKQIWREYDSDNSGYIEADELKNFLRDLLKEAKKINDVSEDKLIEYTDTMVSTDIVQGCISFLHFVAMKEKKNVHVQAALYNYIWCSYFQR